MARAGRRVGLERDAGEGAADDVEAVGGEKGRGHAAREDVGLVREDGRLQAPPGQLAEQLGDAVVGPAVVPPAGLVLAAVIAQDLGDQGVVRGGPAARDENPPDELLGAVADERLHLVDAARGQAAGDVNAVGGLGDVLDRVEERPVEIERMTPFLLIDRCPRFEMGKVSSPIYGGREAA